MELVAVIIVGIWIVLHHLRRQTLIKDYIDLQKKALEKGKNVSLKELMLLEHSRTQNFLRLGIIGLILGLTIFGIGFMNVPSTPNEPVKLIFHITGIIIAAIAIGSLIVWKVIDKPRGERMIRSIEEEQ